MGGRWYNHTPMKTSKEVYDTWAANYDQNLEAGSVPVSFEGYAEVLAGTVLLADVQPGMSVLDLGTGTGNLAALFETLGCDLWGTDFSVNMLAIAHAKLPFLHPVLADLHDLAWPQTLNRRFDRIVSAYVWHEFDLDEKLGLLRRLIDRHLVSQGRVVIADISYPDVIRRNQARADWGRLWSETEYYWAADETIAACHSIGLGCSYQQVSRCAGVFVFEAGEHK
jgi:putative AdoMet-dependent methyltransferase